MHGTSGLQAGKWEFPLTKVRVCPKESPSQQVRLQEWIFMQISAKDTKDTKKMKDRHKKEKDERNYYQESKGDGCDGRDAV